jgi:hypothetical protein
MPMRPESIFSADWMAVKCAATANHSTEISCQHRRFTSKICHPLSPEVVLAIAAMQACRCFLYNADVSTGCEDRVPMQHLLDTLPKFNIL